MIYEATNAPEVIFILGIMPRCGTNFLANLLTLHPDCEGSVIPEDGLVARANFLTGYINHLFHVWEVNDSLQEVAHLAPRELLFESFGLGLSAFLIKMQQNSLRKNNNASANKVRMPKRLVTKTPQVLNVDKFFKLFPDGQLLILVRDGRALVESINTSFEYPREEAIRDWANAAQKIFKFEEHESQHKDKYLIIKYEELHSRTEREMRRILEFLKLDDDKYDFQKALDLPVVGSSTFQRGDGAVHWTPVEKTKVFNPLARAAEWKRPEHERFNWLAKNELVRFGYEPIEFGGGKRRWKLWNHFHDFRWEAGIWRRRFSKFLHFTRKRLSVYFGK